MISVLIPSRGRPNELKVTITSLNISKNKLEVLVWIDTDDPELENYKKLFSGNPNIRLFIKKRVKYQDFHLMLNFLSSKAKFDWQFFFNDDAYMDEPLWFEKFKDFVRQFEPTSQPIVINIWESPDRRYNLFPIVSKKFIEVLGHFSLVYANDTFVQTVALETNIAYNLDGITPKHRKYGGDKDTLKDKTFYEVEKERNIVKYQVDFRRSPYRQMIRGDIQKITSYNTSIESVKNLESLKTIGFIGLGKLGLPIAEAIAKRGFTVLGYDIEKPNTSLPLANSIAEVVQKSDLVFCAVQTPHNPEFEGDKPLPSERSDFDYSYLIKVINEVTAIDKKTNLVVISTCLPGTYKTKLKPILNDNINYIYNPFFIAMGTEVADFVNPELVLIGGGDAAILKFFYAKFHGRDRTFVTDITTAEGIKVFYNTFITTKTVLGNMYGEYSHKLGMNVDHIYEALSKSTDRIISQKYLKSGMADGGGCHPRDNIALSYLANQAGMSFNYFDALMSAREKHTEWLANIFADEIEKESKVGVILGKSFKPETHLQTGSAAILFSNILKQNNVPFVHYEFDYPKNLPVGVYFIATKHPQYATINFPKASVVIDPFRYIKDQEGIRVIRIGGTQV